MFKDRKDAGEKLATALMKYKEKGVVVLAIPKGGVEVGYEVARALQAPFSALVVRKLPFPDDPEAGFGAIAEDGSTILLEGAASWLSENTIEWIKQEQVREIQRRVAVLRSGQPPPDIGKKTVLLVDDGLAMGSTMLAAIAYCRNKKAAKIIVAVPIAGKEVARRVGDAADMIIVLETPAYFRAVAQGYENWYDVPDEEAATILKTYKQPAARG
jgi:predicted phosphoribosyltransferase